MRWGPRLASYVSGDLDSWIWDFYSTFVYISFLVICLFVLPFFDCFDYFAFAHERLANCHPGSHLTPSYLPIANQPLACDVIKGE